MSCPPSLFALLPLGLLAATLVWRCDRNKLALCHADLWKLASAMGVTSASSASSRPSLNQAIAERAACDDNDAAVFIAEALRVDAAGSKRVLLEDLAADPLFEAAVGRGPWWWPGMRWWWW